MYIANRAIGMLSKPNRSILYFGLTVKLFCTRALLAIYFTVVRHTKTVRKKKECDQNIVTLQYEQI